jgi:hypothetical protein
LAAAMYAQDPPVWSAGPIDFSGLVDGYYSLNFNHPASKTNNLRNFDVKANQFSLNMAKVVMEHAAARRRAGAECISECAAGIRNCQTPERERISVRFWQVRHLGGRRSDRNA